MSRLEAEIEACRREQHRQADGSYSASFRFPADFVGFDGHFPGHPVLPGVCKIAAVMAMCRAAEPGAVELIEVISAKFLAPATVNEVLAITCREAAAAAGRRRVKAAILRNGTRIAQIDLCIERKPEP